MKAKVIKNNKEYSASLARIEQLMLKDLKKGSALAEEFELLSLLIHTYEEEHYPIPAPDPIEAIKLRVEELGVPPAQLHALFGSRQRLSDVLNRRRGLTLELMRKLHKELRIPLEVLIGV